MTAYPKETSKAAKWIWDHKEASIDWNWPVLTKRNSADDTLGYGDVLAFQIFTILEKRELIRPLEFTGKDGNLVKSFELLLDNKERWDETKKLGSFWNDWVILPATEIFTHLNRFLLWLGSVVVVAIISALATKLLS